MALRKSGATQNAIRILKTASRFFLDEDTHAQFAIHRSLGLAHLELKDIETAVRHANKAEDLPGLGGPFQVDLLWLKARVAEARGDTVLAINLFRHTVTALEASPGSAALASSELCRVFMTSRHFAEATSTAIGMARFAMPRRQNRVVAAAVTDLYKVARQGTLTMRTIEGVIDRIQKATRRQAV